MACSRGASAEWEGFAAIPEEFLDPGDTIVVLGRYRDIKPELVQAIRRAFEAAGIHFIEGADRFGLTARAGPPRP
jgi:hypothetical protein